MTLALLCQFNAQHVSDVNTSIFRSFATYLLSYCVGWLEEFWCYVAGLAVGDVVSECRLALRYHITNSQSRYITPTHLMSAQYNLRNNTPSSRKLLKMDVLTSETCWAVNWHNKASVIKLVYLYSNCHILSQPWNPDISHSFCSFCTEET